MRINQIEPWIGLQELWQLTRVVKSTFVTEHDLTKEFESSIKKLTELHAVSITNGTLALVSILQSLGVKPVMKLLFLILPLLRHRMQF